VEIQVEESRLVASDRLALVGALLGAVGHELNNLLSVFTNALHFVREDVADGALPDPDDIAGLAHVERQLASHAQRLLALGRPRPAAAGPADLARVVRDAIDLLRGYALKHVEIAVAPCDAVMCVAGDAGELAHAVANVLKLAGDSALAGTGPAAIAVALAREASRARLTVRVAGAGGVRDAGLALLVTNLLAEHCGGRLAIAHEAGYGTTYTLELALASS